MADVSLPPEVRRVERSADPLRLWRRRFGDSRFELGARLLVSILYMCAIFSFSGIEGSQLPRVNDTLSHGLEYFGLGVVLLISMAGLTATHVSASHYVAAWVVALAFGMSDEWHQSIVPGRDASLLDIRSDMFGFTLAIVLLYLLVNRSRPT